MSGLALGTLVIETGELSGAPNTAAYALDHNKEFFAVPGSLLSPKSRGPNHFIREEVKLVSEVKHILEDLNLTVVPQQLEARALVPTTDLEAALLKYLSPEPLHIDEVQRRCHLSIDTVSSTLSMMDLKGLLKQVGAMNCILSREPQASYQVPV